MDSQRRFNPVSFGIYLVAALLVLNLAVSLSRGGSLLPTASADQHVPALTGGNSIYIMPAQFSLQIYGLYLLDTEAGTLCIYQYDPLKRQLNFLAARDYTNDRRLRNYNTNPSPDEIKQLVDKQNSQNHGIEPQKDKP